MKKGLVLLADGFEDTEGIAVIDCLKRAGISLDIVSVMSSNTITTQCNNKMVLEKNIYDCNTSDYDFLFIPGGGAVSNYLMKQNMISNIILDFSKDNKLIATICAAPMLVGKLGLFENRKFTCFPGCEEGIKGKYTGTPTQVSDNFITGKSMGHSLEFALEIVKYLLGNQACNQLKQRIY